MPSAAGEPPSTSMPWPRACSGHGLRTLCTRSPGLQDEGRRDNPLGPRGLCLCRRAWGTVQGQGGQFLGKWCSPARKQLKEKARGCPCRNLPEPHSLVLTQDLDAVKPQPETLFAGVFLKNTQGPLFPHPEAKGHSCGGRTRPRRKIAGLPNSPAESPGNAPPGKAVGCLPQGAVGLPCEEAAAFSRDQKKEHFPRSWVFRVGVLCPPFFLSTPSSCCHNFLCIPQAEGGDSCHHPPAL